MAAFDIGIVKREALDDFHTDATYLDHFMSYNNDVFDAPVDWLSNFVEDRSSLHSAIDQLGHPSDYSNLNMNSSNRDQTLNRLNGLTGNQRAYNEDFTSAFPSYATSPVSPEFDHRLETGAQELDYEMKSFYSASQKLYTHGAMHGDNGEVDKLELQKNHELEEAVSSVCQGDDMAHLSGDSDQDRDDSESGYDSGSRSPTSQTPGTPPRCLLLSQGDDGSSTGDVTSPTREQSKKRQPLFLSEEEKRTLITEGLPIPAGYPLTKSEERALKKVRRKIKNKISAQESRRKKKEYMETLEKRVEMCSGENLDLRRKLESMETSNRALINQLQKLQAIIAPRVSRPTCAIATQTMDET